MPKAIQSRREFLKRLPLGFWIRGIHRWGSNLMIIAILLYMTRVFFTFSFRRPRELNWIIGMFLLFTTLAFAFTGYSLTYNQLSFWATTVGTNLLKEVPIVGKTIFLFLRGGEDVTANTLTRFFYVHVGILPVVLVVLIFLHIFILRLHGVSEPEGFPKGYYTFYPEHFYKITIATLFLLTLLSALTVIFPPGLGIPADPTVTPPHIKPEWYFFPVYRFLKIVPLKVGVYSTIAFLIAITFWPFIEPILSKNPSIRTKINFGVGSLTLIITILFTLWETISP